MDKKSNSRIYAYLAGACFAIAAMYYVISMTKYEYSNTFWIITTIISTVLLCVSLFLQNKTAVLFIASIKCIIDLYNLISAFTVGKLFLEFGQIVFVVIALCMLRGRFKLCSFWLVPAVLCIISFLVTFVSIYYTNSEYGDERFPLWVVLQVYATDFIECFFYRGVQAAAYTLASYWLYTCSPQYAPAMHNPPAKTNSTNTNITECLERYKQLLNCGAITEEEFQTKKKKLLGI